MAKTNEGFAMDIEVLEFPKHKPKNGEYVMAYADCGEGDESTGMNKMEYIPAVFYEEEIERVGGSKFIIQSWTCLDADTWGYIAGLNKVTHFYRIPILPKPN